MSDWSGSDYKGEQDENWYHGRGQFKFPNGVIYDGEFYKGEFHGEGTLIYPNGVTINPAHQTSNLSINLLGQVQSEMEQRKDD